MLIAFCKGYGQDKQVALWSKNTCQLYFAKVDFVYYLALTKQKYDWLEKELKECL